MGRVVRGLGLAEFKRVVRVAVNFLPQDSSGGREGERAGSEGPRANVRLRHTHISPASSINNSSRNLAQTRLVPDNAGRAPSKNKLPRRGKFAAGYRRRLAWLARRRRETVISISRSSRTRAHQRTFGEARQSFIGGIETRGRNPDDTERRTGPLGGLICTIGLQITIRIRRPGAADVGRGWSHKVGRLLQPLSGR